jgi:Flp pilus assembly protein TadG
MRKRNWTATVTATARRGATLVLVAVMLLVLGGMAAFAVELSRVYSGVNELQTGADASALAAGLRMQRFPAASPAAGTVAFASSNNAFNSPVTISGADVVGGFWDPDARTFTPAAWAAANAVRVNVSRTTGMGFGRLLGLNSMTPLRRGTAWIANQKTVDCIKPWGIDITYMNTLLGQPLTTQAGVEALRVATTTLGGQQSVTIIARPDITTPPGSVAPTTFSALTNPNNSSRKAYQNALIGLSCGDGTGDYTVGGTESSYGQQPGNGAGDVPQTTANGVTLNLPGQQGNGGVVTCSYGAITDATCYDPVTGAAGVTVTIAGLTSRGVNDVVLGMVLEFRLMCVFRGDYTGNGNSNNINWSPGTARAAESCPWLAAYRTPAGNFVQGTIVGFPMVGQARTGPGNGLGNTIGTSQKLVLVQ